ncbi:hypothetical protein GCM10027058_29650 [Microbacterium neimengense]
MTPETPPPADRGEAQPPSREPPFGPEAQTSVERSLALLKDPDDALRILSLVKENGAAFAAYLLLPDTNVAAATIEDSFYDTYAATWERFDQLRHDVLDGLGWLQALRKFMDEQGLPEDHLTWNHDVIDQRIVETYDIVHLDGWWHVFHK